jgi:hypothetical protein
MEFLIAFGVFSAIIAMMAVGVIMGRPPLKGSCGGLGQVGIDQRCELCGGDPVKCESQQDGNNPGLAVYDPNSR